MQLLEILPAELFIQAYRESLIRMFDFIKATYMVSG